MRHSFLETIVRALYARGVATLRYEFAYMESGRNRPDPPAVAVARVRDAVQRALAEWPGLPVLAGGKSLGGRMTSTALGPRATLRLIDDADRSFKVPKRSGRTAEQVIAELADRIAEFGNALAVQ